MCGALPFFICLYGADKYEYETWSLTLREERRLRVFKNRVLRVFGPKRDEVTGEWRKLHSRSLGILLPTQYCAGGKIEKNKVGGACGAYGGEERCAQGSSGETRGKEAIGETQT